MSVDRLITSRAAAQFGCIAVDQARALGLTPHQIRHRLEVGRWERLGQRVFRMAGAPATWEQSLLAGLLDLGTGAVVSHRAAAALHGFDGFPAGPVEFTVPRARRGMEARWTIHTALRLDRIDLATVGPFACTSASRTILDLARTASPAELERAIDSAVRDGLASPIFLRKRLADRRGPGYHGVRLLDELLVDSGGHSALERAFLRLLRGAGLPLPSCQRRFERDGVTVARVDFCLGEPPIVIEVSGRRGHSSPAERAKDARRRNELQAAGYLVLEFTYQDVHRRPEYVLRTLRHHLGRPAR